MELAQDRVQWQALVLAVLNLRVMLPELHVIHIVAVTSGHATVEAVRRRFNPGGTDSIQAHSVWYLGQSCTGERSSIFLLQYSKSS